MVRKAARRRGIGVPVVGFGVAHTNEVQSTSGAVANSVYVYHIESVVLVWRSRIASNRSLATVQQRSGRFPSQPPGRPGTEPDWRGRGDRALGPRRPLGLTSPNETVHAQVNERDGLHKEHLLRPRRPRYKSGVATSTGWMPIHRRPPVMWAGRK